MKATFVIPQPGALKYQRISCWKVFFKALSLPSNEEPDSTFEELEKIVQISKASGSVVVIFAEGTTSNSRGLLPFANQLPFCSIPSSSTIFPTALKYTPPTITTPVPTNIFIWLFKLFGELQGVSVLVKFGHRVGVDPAKPNNESLTKEICDNICLSGKLRRVGLGIESKRSFVEAWNRKR
jgi:1-acyl-sn-glycerol-3-phosphate acyltransferase